MFAFRMKFLSNMFLFTIIFIVNYWFLGNGWRQAGDSTWHKPALTPFTAGICFMFFPWRPYCLRDQVTRPWYWLCHTDRFRFFSCMNIINLYHMRCYDMETFSALLVLCEENVLVTHKRPIMQSFVVYFFVRMTKLLNNSPLRNHCLCHITIMHLEKRGFTPEL